MDRRSVARIMLAGSSLTPADEREAALIGGLTRSIVTNNGRFSPELALMMAMGINKEMGLSADPPYTAQELAAVVTQYQRKYTTVEVG